MKRVVSFLITVLLAVPAGAVRHVTPGAFPKAHHDEIGRPSTARIRAAGSLRAAILGGASGTKNVAVILVQFPAGNASLISGNRLIQNPANIDSYFSSMADYFTEVSHNNLTLNFKFFGDATGADTDGSDTAAAALGGPGGGLIMPQPMEYYGCGDEGLGCGGTLTPTFPVVTANGNYLIRDALVAARAETGGGPTAGVVAGTFHAVMVMHAGNGNETVSPSLGTYGDIWSIFYSQDTVIAGTNPISAPAAAAGFTQGLVVPETESSGISSPLGVMCHEFGHELGLPDLYNTSFVGGSSVVGEWDLMDSGAFAANGANPTHPGAWSKYTLGWITPITSTGSASIGFVETPPPPSKMIKINVANGLPQEYFLVEYRSPSAGTYDTNIPGTGLLIWHVDDTIAIGRGIDAADPNVANTVNSGNPHRGVDIVTANGTNPAGGMAAGQMFGNTGIFITPRSDNFAGEPSGISIVNISGVGTAQATMNVSSLLVSAGQNIIRVANYPNPAGPGYSHPTGAGHTTLQFQLTRPAQDYSINIYNLSADLVRKIAKSDINLQVGTPSDRSTDYKWVYEYVWDLKNGNGAHVAPGVYLYMIRADGESKTGKAVIIR